MKLTELFSGQWPGTILFDLDGTLVDSAPDLAVATDTMLQALGKASAGEAQVRTWVGNGAAVLVRRALAGRHDYEDDGQHDETVFERAMALFLEAYHSVNGHHATLFEGIETFLQAAHSQGCKLGVVTNKPAAFTDDLLERMGLAHWFDITVSGDTLPVKKPAPEPLFHALDALGGCREDALMVGDSITDISAAKNAGLPVVAVRYGYNHGGPVDGLGAEIVVDSLTELL
ncbi:phosphoglycolate phosphatase [Marinobacter zhejiangensis]|uniref:Phosphoglycolate phosphatase n=1 Tax=Marinobacter zhejiangensis TaxID=488535 RepID=A0A1I4L2V6_9GAMM|nr:phosphoglycolate phosphatase [Marinobacter zhejiangensis]SFL84997.1 phosphoglycolate phosphatase [Marinobacter zhejiangensis]